MADKPLSVDQTLLKAKRHAQRGEADLAERLYRLVLARFPNNNRAIAGLNALKGPGAPKRSSAPSQEQIAGLITLYNQGRLREALTQGANLAAQYPTAGIVHNILGVVSAGLGRLDQAIACYTKALQVTPDYPEALNNLGNAYSGLGKLDEAEASYAKALRINPYYAEAHNNLGNVLRDSGRNERAIASYAEALKLKPNFAEAHNNLGSVCFDIGEHDKAIDCYTKALQIRPEYPEALNNIGIVLRELDRHDEAIASYTEALRIRPDYVVAHNNLGNAFRDAGKHEEAIASYSRALQIRPDFAEAHYSLGTLQRYKPSDPRIPEMLAQLASRSISERDRTLLSFALGKAYDDIGDTESAFKHLLEGNRLRNKELGYDINSDATLFNLVKSLFVAGDLPVLDEIEPFAERKKRPIFIVGMPRSGTTLVEQILASHSQVFGAGELRALARVASPVVENLRRTRSGRLTGDAIRHVKNSYLAELDHVGGDVPFVTDKMPLNFRWIGFILTAMPGAKVVNVQRDPVATCWSVFKYYFSSSGNGYAYDMTDIANYYGLYSDMMTYWRKVFPGKIYDLDYESLTEEQEQETRSLLEFCGLGWEENCLEFHRTERSVKTASAFQVRQKLYKGSSEAWRKYVAHLGPMLQALADGRARVDSGQIESMSRP